VNVAAARLARNRSLGSLSCCHRASIPS
jgi:hypothetical protein